MYDPPLSGVRDQLTQRLPERFGDEGVLRLRRTLLARRRIQRSAHLRAGPARMSNDTCIPGDDHGVILMFLEGDQARTFGTASRGRAPHGADRGVGTPLRQQGSSVPSSTWTGNGRIGSGPAAATTPTTARTYGPPTAPRSAPPSARSTGRRRIRPPIGAPTWRARSTRASEQPSGHRRTGDVITPGRQQRSEGNHHDQRGRPSTTSTSESSTPAGSLGAASTASRCGLADASRTISGVLVRSRIASHGPSVPQAASPLGLRAKCIGEEFGHLIGCLPARRVAVGIEDHHACTEQLG